MVCCISPNGEALSSSDELAKDLLVGTVDGVRAFGRDSAGQFTSAFTSLEGRHVGALAYEPVSGKVFAAAYGAGLFVSDDGGRIFTPCMNGLVNDESYLSAYSFAVQPRENQVALYVGIEPAALFRSFDFGQTWTELDGVRSMPRTVDWSFPEAPHRAHVKSIGFAPGEPTTLYLAVEVGALLKSVDDGKTWQEIHSYDVPEDPSNHDSHRVVVDPKDPRRVYLTSGPGVYTSADGGMTWIHRTNRESRIGYADFFFIDPDDMDTLYLGGASTNPPHWPSMGGSTMPGVLRSTDCGATWDERMDGLPVPVDGNIEAMSMHISPGSVEMFAATTTGDLYYSARRAEDWCQIASGLPATSKGHHHHYLDGNRQLL